MKCSICGISPDSIDEIIEQEWISYFFEGDEEHGPICPSCSEKLISIASDGEYELKDEYRGKIVYNDHLEIYEDDPLTDVVLGFILN